MQLIGTPGTRWFDDDTHLRWLAAHRAELLDFYQPEVTLPGAGLAYLDTNGHALTSQGSQLWLTARMIHVFALAHLMGRAGADKVVEHGLDFLVDGPGHDGRYGGWFAAVGGVEASQRKELYGHAHVLLAGSSAMQAGFSGGEALVNECLDIIDRYFWVEADGACREAFDRTFTDEDDYRGQNANMHLTEALMAAYEVTGDAVLLQRARRIATRIAGPAASGEPGSHRLVEHFTLDWQPMPEFNRDQPRHKFRPFGSQPGHWLEWAKLLLQLQGQGVDEPWLLPAARNLFDGAIEDGMVDGGGFVYTVDFDGIPVVEERFFWEPAEAMGAARMLYLATNEDRYAAIYQQIWQYCHRYFIDHTHGSWFPELDIHNEPLTATWPGKPDLYHVFQATMYAQLPQTQGLAAWAANPR